MILLDILVGKVGDSLLDGWRVVSMYEKWDMLDVLTPLSDCRQEPVEKMARRISGVSYMYWMDFYNEIFCCGFYVLD